MRRRYEPFKAVGEKPRDKQKGSRESGIDVIM